MKKREEGGSMKHDHTVKFQFLPTLIVLLNLACLLLRQKQRSLEFQLVRLDDKDFWEPFRGSEFVSKLTEGPKNRPEAFCGALRLCGSAVRVDP